MTNGKATPIKPAASQVAQSKKLIFVWTTYALDPNRAILTRLLIDLDQKFILLPIERFTQHPAKIAKTDMVLIDAVHLAYAGRSSRVTKLLFDYQDALAVVAEKDVRVSRTSAKRHVSHEQLRQQLSMRTRVNRPVPLQVAPARQNRASLPETEFSGSKGVNTQTPDLTSKTANLEPLFDRQLAIKRARGQPVLAMDLYHLLKVSLDQDLADLAVALREENLIKAQRTLHKLSGALALTGAHQLEQAVKVAIQTAKTDEHLGEARSVMIAGEQLLALMNHTPWEMGPN